MSEKRCVVIVDGYSAGNLLAPEFLARGTSCVHVQSTREIWPLLLPSFRPEDYQARLTNDCDIGKMGAALAAYHPLAVLPGTETGVELADSLSHALRLPGNGVLKSRARRDKFLMGEAVRSAGLRVAKQVAANSVEKVLDWAAREKLESVVVKPPESAGTDCVAVCHSWGEIKNAVSAILGKTNKLGLDNTFVLAQEFLEGTEFFLNTVSWEGQAHFTDIWKYRKRSINGRSFVYDCNELMDYSSSEAEVLVPYVRGVLQALEIDYGPAHTEIMLTSQGPVLVESGARLDGLSVPSVNSVCLGYGPVDLTVDAWVDRARYVAKTAKPYCIKKHARTVYLTSYEEGTVEEIPGEGTLRGLESFFQMRLRVKPGSSIKKTIDYFTAPGFLTLVHSDAEVVERDYEAIRQIERDGSLFRIQCVTGGNQGIGSGSVTTRNQ